MLLFFHVILIFADGFHGSITFHGINIKTLEAKKKKKKTVLLLWSWEEGYITSWNSGEL